MKRTADKHDALMAETPARAQDSPMVARRSTKNGKIVLPRILAVWRPGQPVVRGTGVMATSETPIPILWGNFQTKL